ncbi:MAG: DMT family transporter [Lachnospiraceae bacterium]|nr:DMT family transporter [Lachnospiraceae bacterium]
MPNTVHPKTSNTHQLLMGMVFIILSALAFAFMSLFVRLAGDLPSFEKVFFRNLFAVFIAFYLLRKKGLTLKPKAGLTGWHLLRSLTGFAGVIFNFYAIDHLIISDASMLNKLSPFFAIIFSLFILKEKLRPVQGVALIIAFIGVLFVAKPSFQMTAAIPYLSGILGGLAAGFAYTCVRKMSLDGEAPELIITMFSGISTLICLPLILFAFVMPTPIQLGYMILSGISAAAAQVCITKAYGYAPASEISIYDYTNILFSAILGYLFLSQTPDGLSVLGYFIILSASLGIYLWNNRRNK